MRKVIVVFGFLLPLVCTAVGAESLKAYRCDTCSTPLEFNEHALSPPYMRDRYVFNLATGTIKKFHLTQGQEDGSVPRTTGDRNGGKFATWTATEVPVEPEVSEFFSDVASIYDELGGSLHYQEVLGLEEMGLSSGSEREGREDAYNFVLNSQWATQVLDAVDMHFDNNPELSTLGRLSVQGGVNFIVADIDFDLQAQVSVEFKVEFDDSSSVKFEYNRQTGRVQYQEGSARDSNGNMIPDNSHTQPNGSNPNGLIGNWWPSDVNSWLDSAELRGVKVTRGTGSRIQCGRVNGGTLQCLMAIN